jgi:LysM repeat protein
MALGARNKTEEKAYSLETRKSLEQAVRRNPAMGILWHNLGRNYSRATYDIFEYVNTWLPLADVCFDMAVHCAPRDEYLLLNAGRYWVWRSRLLTEEGKEERGNRKPRLNTLRLSSSKNLTGQGGTRKEESSTLVREDGIIKFQVYFQRLLFINPELWKEVVQHTRVYFPDDAVVLGIVPENDEALESRVLGFLAKTESSLSVKESGQPETRRYHTVESGETLYSISRRYGVAVKKILLMNDLDRGVVVYPGQRLRVGN